MFGAILKTHSSFQKDMTFCRSINVKKVMKLLAFIFEQSSYCQALYCLFFRLQCSPFIIHLFITPIWIQHLHFCGSQIVLPWNFTMEL